MSLRIGIVGCGGIGRTHMQAWLAAIPSELWQVFGVCFSVYGVTRTVEKVRGVAR